MRRSSLIDKDSLKDSKSPPPKKVCRGYTDEQIKRLEEFFTNDDHAEQYSLNSIEKETKLSEYLVKKWFKLKRESLKQNEIASKSLVEDKNQLDIKEEKTCFEDKSENSQDCGANENENETLKNLSADIIDELEKTFDKTPILRPLDKKALSLRLGLKTSDIERWFNSKRKEKEEFA